MRDNTTKEPNNHTIKRAVRLANLATFESPDFIKNYDIVNTGIFNKHNQERIHEIIGKLSTYGNGCLLDVGCGTGNILKHAVSYFLNIYGIDHSAEALKCTTNYTLNVVKRDVVSYPLNQIV